jgi:nucleotide-binding universal stress UspA family protein
MVAFARILCPVDFSSCSELALDYALSLAKERGGQVSVMHVLPDVMADPDVYPYLAEPVLVSGETRERAYKQLGSFVSRALSKSVAADVVLESGDVVEEILRKSDRLGPDLVVVGTHGRRGFQRLLLGSVTERLLRRSKVPVLSIAPSAAPPPREGATFRRILCPVDFSPSSLAGLETALSLAREQGEILVLHLVEFYYDPGMGEAIAYDLGELREGHLARAEERLRELVPESARPGVRVRVEVLRSGGPYQEILRIAGDEKRDLLVMGVAGRSASDLLFFGSTANHVVRSAAAPVLTVRSEG